MSNVYFQEESDSENELIEDKVVAAPYGLLLAMLTLAAGGLFVGSGEFSTMSLLPSLASATGVTIPVAGSYISAYAAGVVVGAPLLSIIFAAWPRKRLLLLLLAIAASGYGLSATAQNYGFLLAARFIAGIPHGAWYGVASLVAGTMVPARKRATYIGYVMLGLAAANVAGVPVITWIGQLAGWRAAFGVVFAGFIITGVMVKVFIPFTEASADASPRSEIKALLNGQVWLTLAVASVGFGGMFAVYSYITPSLTEVSGYALSSVPWILVLWGLGMVTGNLAGGALADRALTPAILIFLVWNVSALILFSLTAHSQILVAISLFLLGMGFALVPALQARLMEVSQDAPTLAASLNHSAFNLANAIGAILGGLSVSAGYGWTSTGWVGAALALGGLLIMLLSLTSFLRR